ncbi:hypothetical protein DPEC_G00057140 [Dallia pectoralis]|uniref:Uncharacterized protein n=1 Tax=Dallia pectoralis TaxID=75939 RepID=A0ACC2H5Z2_DALPE|nr:hypothetical protein DPEC_G00057140 [Dallia pectoralis]
MARKGSLCRRSGLHCESFDCQEDCVTPTFTRLTAIGTKRSGDVLAIKPQGLYLFSISVNRAELGSVLSFYKGIDGIIGPVNLILARHFYPETHLSTDSKTCFLSTAVRELDYISVTVSNGP